MFHVKSCRACFAGTGQPNHCKAVTCQASEALKYLISLAFSSLVFIMPGTHLLPPNLLKLFAPRPPLPYSRPVDKDIDRITKKNVAGVGPILTQLKEATTEGLITAGEGDAMEEGEEPAYTHAEEVKRQIRREERKKKRTEEFKVAKEACEPFL